MRAEDADGFYFSPRPVKPENAPLQPGADEDKMRMPHHEQDMPGCNGGWGFSRSVARLPARQAGSSSRHEAAWQPLPMQYTAVAVVA